jgi:DNA-binding response OmpR family regulator
MPPPIRILFIDDDPNTLSALEKIAAAKSWHAVSSPDGLRVNELVDEHSVDIVASDHYLPGKSGIEVLAELKSQHPNVVRVLMSTGADRDMVKRAVLEGGVHAVIEKPWRMEGLVSTISAAATLARSLRSAPAPDLRGAMKTFKR